ncbi:hypothetical protein Tco_0255908 [Tanacetum coccineum]
MSITCTSMIDNRLQILTCLVEVVVRILNIHLALVNLARLFLSTHFFSLLKRGVISLHGFIIPLEPFIELSTSPFALDSKVVLDPRHDCVLVSTSYVPATGRMFSAASICCNEIKSARATPKAHLPYGMFLTRLFRHVMEHYPHLDNGIYDVVERVMRPLVLRQARRPRSDRGKAHHSVSSTFAHYNRESSSHQGDDDGASRASTPSPTTYLNSLGPLDYQQYDVPTSSEQNDDLLFERQTDLLNQTQQMHKELRGGFKSFGKALRGVFGKKKK